MEWFVPSLLVPERRLLAMPPHTHTHYTVRCRRCCCLPSGVLCVSRAVFVVSSVEPFSHSCCHSPVLSCWSTHVMFLCCCLLSCLHLLRRAAPTRRRSSAPSPGLFGCAWYPPPGRVLLTSVSSVAFADVAQQCCAVQHTIRMSPAVLRSVYTGAQHPHPSPRTAHGRFLSLLRPSPSHRTSHGARNKKSCASGSVVLAPECQVSVFG